MSRSEFEQDDPHPAPPREGLFYGIAGAFLIDTAFSAPAAFVMPLVRPENVALAVGKLLLAVNLLVGYVGGRLAARAGLSHEDSRSQWTMASVVTGLSVMVESLLYKLRVAMHLVHAAPADAQNAAADRATLVVFAFWITVVMLLVRFGFAMGTYSQAKRDGRVREEDEASVE